MSSFVAFFARVWAAGGELLEDQAMLDLAARRPRTRRSAKMLLQRIVPDARIGAIE